jgi:drug/metabolite transporter (DMT)-like permease
MATALIILAMTKVTLQYKIEKYSKHDLMWGVFWGVLAMIAMVLGNSIIAKSILNRSPFLWVTEIRFIGGLSMLAILLIFNKRRRKIILSLTTAKSRGYVFLGSFIGAYMALLFWLTGMKYTTVSISAVLNQTSQIFIFILAAIFLKEPFDKHRLFSTIIGFTGVILIILG